MEFTDLIALKVKELMNEKNITIYRLESLSGVYTSTISQFLTRKTKTLRISGSRQVKVFLDYIYNEADIYIERKHDVYLKRYCA